MVSADVAVVVFIGAGKNDTYIIGRLGHGVCGTGTDDVCLFDCYHAQGGGLIMLFHLYNVQFFYLFTIEFFNLKICWNIGLFDDGLSTFIYIDTLGGGDARDFAAVEGVPFCSSQLFTQV